MSERQRRVDADQVRMTGRDAELLEFMAHQYALPLDLLQSWLEVGQPRVYQLVQRWKRAGWVLTSGVDRGPTWVYPTRAIAQRFLGWQAPEWAPRSTLAPHVRAVAATRLHVAGRQLDAWTSERKLRHDLDQARSGQVRGHVPDGIHWTARGGYAIEVELTGKGRQRTEAALTALGGFIAKHSLVGAVYFCTPNAMSVVQELIAREREEERRRSDGRQRQGGPAFTTEWHVRSVEEVPFWTVQG